MDKVNAYQPPMTDSVEEAKQGTGKFFAADRCPDCHLPFTFWLSTRQLSPLHFQCPRCDTRCRIHAPHMKLIYLGVLVNIGLASSIGYGCTLLVGMPVLPGPLSVLLVLLMLAPFMIGAQLWIYRYVQRHGRFELLSLGKEAGGDAVPPGNAE